MKGEWSLDSMYKGFEDPKFVSELKRLEELKAEFERAVTELPDRSEKENLRVLIPLLEEKFILTSMLSAYCEFRRSVNTSDGDAASYGGKIALAAGSIAAYFGADLFKVAVVACAVVFGAELVIFM